MLFMQLKRVVHCGVTLTLLGSQPIIEANEHQNEINSDTEAISPARRINRDGNKPPKSDRSNPAVPTLDGGGNNIDRPNDNLAHTPLRRFLSNDYADGTDELAGNNRPGPREISNAVFAQDETIENNVQATDFVWQWGQFIDHDLDLTDGTTPSELFPIAIPAGDAAFDPDVTGAEFLAFNRSIYEHDNEGIRQQINEITGWIDASSVYGSDDARADALRTLDGTGKLATSPGDLLPFNTQGFSNAGGDSDQLFLAGDPRANEQVGLTAMHTLFVREHNRWVDVLTNEDPELDGDDLYNRARSLVAAELQIITYEEFLPILLGGKLPPYRGYNQSVDARIMNEFSTAAYRFGHSMLSPQILRLDQDLGEIEAGHLPLRNAFFARDEILQHGIESLLRGLSRQVAQEVDSFVIDDVRNFLFGSPGDGGFDLVSLNIQRGRDHGLPSYNNARTGFGLSAAESFADVSTDPEVITRLQAVYPTVNDVDFWVGALAEDRLPGAMVGELLSTVITLQFIALRDGDRFWYENQLSKADRERVRGIKLSDIIRFNTEIGSEISDDVFHFPSAHPPQRKRNRDKKR